MIFRLQGVDTARFLAAHGFDTIMPAAVSERILAAQQRGADLPRSEIWLFTTTRPSELLCNCTRIRGADGRELNAVLAEDFSEAERQGRLQVRAYARFFREQLAGCEACRSAAKACCSAGAACRPNTRRSLRRGSLHNGFSYGQALGVAAGLAKRERLQPRELPGKAVREALNRQGARLDD